LAFPTNLHGLGAVTPGLRGLPDTVQLSIVKIVSTTLMSFAPSSKTPTGTRRPYRLVRCLRSAEASRPHLTRLTDFLSWDFPKIAPPLFQLRESSPSSPLRKVTRLRPCAAKHRTPSALVVPPDSDGLLLTKPRRSIAPCIQPWGSSRFQPRLPLPVLRPSTVLVAFPELAVHTLRSFPLADSRTASPQPLPPRRSTGAFHIRRPHRNASRSRFRPVTRFSALVLPPVHFR